MPFRRQGQDDWLGKKQHEGDPLFRGNEHHADYAKTPLVNRRHAAKGKGKKSIRLGHLKKERKRVTYEINETGVGKRNLPQQKKRDMIFAVVQEPWRPVCIPNRKKGGRGVPG